MRSDSDGGGWGERLRSDLEEEWDGRSRRRRRARHHRDERDEPGLSRDERAYRAARRRARLKIGFFSHLSTYLIMMAFFVLMMGWNSAATIGFWWGFGLFWHFFGGVVGPWVRNRFVDAEVGRQVHRNVTQERRTMETRHGRSLEELSSSIAHEIRNPITAAKSLVQQIQEDPSSEENAEYASVAVKELDRVERSISHLLRYSRDVEMRFEETDLRDIVDSALDTFRDRFKRMAVDVRREADSSGPVHGDPEQLRRVVINLVSNALDALEESEEPELRLDVTVGENLAGTEVWLKVRDNGPGMEKKIASKIFNPFFTTKETGTGQGLALARKVIDAHGGSIEVETASRRGSEMIVTLPKSDAGEIRR